MAYKLASFDDYPLPEYNADYDNARAVRPSVVTIPGGWLDLYRDQQMRMAQAQISARGLLINEWNKTIQGEVEELDARLGKQAQLVRKWQDGTTQQIRARLIAVDGPHNSRHLHNIKLTFLTDEDHWGGFLVGYGLSTYANSWTLGSGVTLGEGLIQTTVGISAGMGSSTLELRNDGNAIAVDPVITVKAIGGAITKARFWQLFDGLKWVEWEVRATISSGTELRVHCGIKSITIGGVNAWGNFEFKTGHKTTAWVLIPPGGSTLRFELTGGGNNHEVKAGAYRHAWH